MITTVVLVLGGVIALFIVIGVGHRLYIRAYISNRYVWLELLDREEWRTTRWIGKQMRHRVGVKAGRILYQDLGQLEEEGLVEGREQEIVKEGTLPLYEYRLTDSGLNRKSEREQY